MNWYKEYVHTSNGLSGVCVFCYEYIDVLDCTVGCSYIKCISFICNKCKELKIYDTKVRGQWFCSSVCALEYSTNGSNSPYRFICYTQLNIYNDIVTKNIYEQVKSFYPNVISDIIAQYSWN